MKSKVRLSGYSLFITTIIDTVLLAGCIATYKEIPAFYAVLSIAVILIIFSLLYAPISINANSEYIAISSVLKSKKINMRNVASVELFQPTLGAIRIVASGGYMGYWGLFREGDVGRYYAAFGKASDCFIIRMKNGDKYVLGCENRAEMVNYIKSEVK